MHPVLHLPLLQGISLGLGFGSSVEHNQRFLRRLVGRSGRCNQSGVYGEVISFTSSFKAFHNLEANSRASATPYIGKHAAIVCIVSRLKYQTMISLRGEKILLDFILWLHLNLPTAFPGTMA